MLWRAAIVCIAGVANASCGDNAAGNGAPASTFESAEDNPLGSGAAAEEATLDAHDGEQTKQSASVEDSKLSAADLQQLREISDKAIANGLSQDAINTLSNRLSAITNQHDYLVALNAAISATAVSNVPSSELGVSAKALNAADYPADCVDKSVSYNIIIQTGNREDAGTDARVFLKLRGNYNRRTKWTELMTLPTSKYLFERGSLFTADYWLTSPGELDRINLYHDNSGNKPGWFVDTVTAYDSCSRRVYVTAVTTWLARDEPPLYGTSYTGRVSAESTY